MAPTEDKKLHGSQTPKGGTEDQRQRDEQNAKNAKAQKRAEEKNWFTSKNRNDGKGGKA
jgi:hypothetical protein